MVNVHNIIMMYISRHMYGKHGGVISGKEGLELHIYNPLEVDETIQSV